MPSIEPQYFHHNLWPQLFRKQISESPHFREFAGRVWTHLKRDADQHLSHELLEVRARALRWGSQTRDALSSLLRLFRLAEETGLAALAARRGLSAADLANLSTEPSEEESDIPDSKIPEKHIQQWEEEANAFFRMDPVIEVGRVLRDDVYQDVGRGKAELRPEGDSMEGVSPEGNGPTLKDYWRSLCRKLVRHEIRQTTAWCMTICLDQERAVPQVEGAGWKAATEEIKRWSQEEDTGEIAKLHEAVLPRRTFRSQRDDPAATVAQIGETVPKILAIDLRGGLEQGTAIANDVRKRYKKNRENKQYHASAEQDLNRIQEQLGQARKILHLLRSYTELHPEWKTQAEARRRALRKIPGGHKIAESVLSDQKTGEERKPKGNLRKLKAQLREKRNELKAQSSAKLAIMRAAEQGEELPQWNDVVEYLREEGQRVGFSFEDISSKHAKRCRAVAQIELDRIGPGEGEISRVSGLVTKVKGILGDPTLSVEKLRYSLEQLELPSGENVYYTGRRNPTDEQRRETIRERVSRARTWCEKHSIPWRPARLPK